MQGTLACALIMHVERRLRGIAEGERWRDRKPRLPAAQEYPFRNGEGKGGRGEGEIELCVNAWCG